MFLLRLELLQLLAQLSLTILRRQFISGLANVFKVSLCLRLSRQCRLDVLCAV